MESLNNNSTTDQFANEQAKLGSETIENFESLKGKALLAFFSIIIIIISALGKNIAKEAIKNPTDKDSKDTILRNEKISQFSLGLGSGFLLYTIMSNFIHPVKIAFIGILLGVMSGITINSFGELNDDENCKDKIQDTYGVMYGIMGSACGMILAGLIVSGLENVSSGNEITPIVILGIFMCVINIFLCSININTANNSKNIDKGSSVGLLIFSIFALIGSVVFIVKTGGKP